MPTVIMQVRSIVDDYDPPANFCYVDLDTATARDLCALIVRLRALKAEGGFFAGLFDLETLSTPAVAFNTRLDYDSADWVARPASELQPDPLRDAETGKTFTEAFDAGDDYLVCPDGHAFLTDEDTLDTDVDTMQVSVDGVRFSFGEKHANGRGETNSLHYWQLAAWAGLVTLPRPWRELGDDAAVFHAFLEAHQIPDRPGS